MPLPNPRQNENQNDFISRCMGSDIMNEEYPNQDQRSAVCYSQWRGQSNQQELSCHRTRLTSHYTTRQETYLGRKHIVAPVVLMVEGVHNGSKGPTLYSAEELSKFPEAWNGRPIPVYHPENEQGPISCNDPDVMEQYSVGQLFNCHFTDGKLKGEIWIDEERANEISPAVLSYMNRGQRLEVSTGVFTEDELSEGSWNGEAYRAIAHNLRPDHLSLLPGEKGACSWEDGCGVRANQNQTYQEGGDKMADTKTTVEQQPQKTHPIQVNQVGEGYRETLEKVQRKLDAMDNDYKMHFLEELYDDYLVYTIRNQESDEARSYKRTYSLNNDGMVEFGDSPAEVVKQVDWKEMEGQQNLNQHQVVGPKQNAGQENNNGGDIDMKKVDELINNKKTQFTEDDREWLSNLSEDQLVKLNPPEEPEPEPAAQPTTMKRTKEPAKSGSEVTTGSGQPKTEPQEVVTNNDQGDVTTTMDTSLLPQKTVEEAIQICKENLSDEEQYLSLMPEAMQAKYRYGAKLYDAKRQELVHSITANSTAYREDELKSKDTDELQKLVSLVKGARTGYFGVNSQDKFNQKDTGPEPLMPVGIEFNTQQ